MLAAAAPADAQRTRTFTACTPDALVVCAEFRLTAGPTLFEIALRTVGAAGAPASPLSIYNVVFGTGAAAAPTPISTLLPPVAAGGAAVTEATDWEVFDAGDALFLSALSNRGVGGCITGADVGGFGQAVTTCGAGHFALFRFAPLAAYDPSAFTVLNLEAVVLAPGLPAATCGESGAACVITADTSPATTVPEPASVVLVGAGLLAAVAVARRTRP